MGIVYKMLAGSIFKPDRRQSATIFKGKSFTIAIKKVFDCQNGD